MATSPNFNWPEPDNTDLVKNGALAIRTAVDAIDSSMGDLKGGTTGQVLAKASNTDMDFVWSADAAGISPTIVNAKGDIIGASANDTPAITSVGADGSTLVADSSTATGLKWATPATGMTNPMTTTGDTIYSSSGSTPARLGIGSTGQVLTVAGGVPTWATPAAGGGMTLLSTTTLSGATVTISSISQSYKQLVAVIYGVTNATANGTFRLAPNGVTNKCAGVSLIGDGSGGGAITRYDRQDYWRIGGGATNLVFNNANNCWVLTINNYTSTAQRKTINSYGIWNQGASLEGTNSVSGGYDENTAISSLVFSNSGGNLSTGTVLLYGVN